MKILIYAFRHNETGRIYIGSTETTKRIETHFNSANQLKHKVPLINKDCEKYGFNFTAYILEVVECDNKEEAMEAERKWMIYFDTGNPMHGYNYRDKKAKKKPIESFTKYTLEDWKPESTSIRALKTLLKENNITGYKLAKGIGTSEQSVYAWLKGEYEPSIGSLKKIARFFNVPITYFI